MQAFALPPPEVVSRSRNATPGGTRPTTKAFKNPPYNMSEGSQLTFRGSSAAEAEDFVQAVRRKAWAEQRQFDYKWMAAYAAVQMSGQALRWHMSLPRDIQSNWGKLEAAILDRYATDQLPAPSNK
ncbi:hypothetical protein FS837_012846 [Tulasnella sp. UAMH 9824]|nr:hypothetical protein FS837_012846 [Tulasnella sp. UAMH 9824]